MGLDTADNVVIDTIWQKYTIWQKSGVSAIVCREKVKRDRILWILAERYIILSENAVGIWENGENLIQFGESETFWQNLIRFGKSETIRQNLWVLLNHMIVSWTLVPFIHFSSIMFIV